MFGVVSMVKPSFIWKIDKSSNRNDDRLVQAGIKVLAAWKLNDYPLWVKISKFPKNPKTTKHSNYFVTLQKNHQPLRSEITDTAKDAKRIATSYMKFVQHSNTIYP